MPYGTIYMLPTPIGDRPVYDVLPEYNRAVMARLDYFIVENERTARRFLSRAGIGKPIDGLRIAELNEHTTPEQVAELLAPVLGGADAGVLSEAGLPGVADPGADLTALAHRHGIRVTPLVGPSSILLALMASGLNGQSFAFNGYLPVKHPERGQAIRRLEQRARTEGQSQLFIETPYRNLRLFDELTSLCADDTLLTVAADILQPDELIRTAPVRQWRGHAPDRRSSSSARKLRRKNAESKPRTEKREAPDDDHAETTRPDTPEPPSFPLPPVPFRSRVRPFPSVRSAKRIGASRIRVYLKRGRRRNVSVRPFTTGSPKGRVNKDEMPLSQVGTVLKKLMPKYRIKRYGCKTLGVPYERLDRYELVKTEKRIAGMARRKEDGQS